MPELDQPVAVLFIDVERHTAYFNVLGTTRPGNHSPAFHRHQRNAQLNDAVMVVVSRKLGRKNRTNRVLNRRPVM